MTDDEEQASAKEGGEETDKEEQEDTYEEGDRQTDEGIGVARVQLEPGISLFWLLPACVTYPAQGGVSS